MTTYSDNEEIALPLVRRHVPATRTAVEIEAEEDERSHAQGLYAIPDDRMTPAVAGGIVGLLAGLAAFGLVHGLEPEALGRPVASVASLRGVDLAATWGIAYVTAGAIGSLVGAAFAVVTRYLRKWGPLALWALVFFVSLAMLLLAAASVYGRGAGATLSGPILAAASAFGLIVSFSLPIRRRH